MMPGWCGCVFAFFAAGHIYGSQADYGFGQSYYKGSNCTGTVLTEMIQLDGCVQAEEKLSSQMTCSNASHGVVETFTNADCSGKPAWYNNTPPFPICQTFEDHGSAFSVKPSFQWTSMALLLSFSCVSSASPAPVPTGYDLRETQFAGGSTCSNLVPRTIVVQGYILVNTCINYNVYPQIISCNKTSMTISSFDPKDMRCTQAAIYPNFSYPLGCLDHEGALVYECLA